MNSFFTQLWNGKKTGWLYLVMITVVFWVNYSKMFDPKLDMNGDNIIYYNLGKSLCEGQGFTDNNYFVTRPHTHFPPGYPVFVAGIMKFFPEDIVAVKAANGILLFLSLILLFFVFRRFSGNIFIPFITLLFCASQYEILRYATIMMSEMLFLFLSVLTIFLMQQIRVNELFTRKGWKNMLALAGLLLCIAYIYFVRTMGISFILAIVLYYGVFFIQQAITWYRRREISSRKLMVRYLLLAVLVCTAFGASKTGWDIRNRSVGKTGSDYMNDFKKKPRGEVMSTWQDWQVRVSNNVREYLTIWIPTSIRSLEADRGKQPSTTDWLVGFVFLALLVIGLLGLKEGKLLLFFYLGITFGVLLVWPEQYAGVRYFINVLPLLIFLFFLGIHESVRLIYQRVLHRGNQPWVNIAVILLIAIFGLIPGYRNTLKSWSKFAVAKTWMQSPYAPVAYLELLHAAEWCKQNLPRDARILCRKPEIFNFYSGLKSSSFPNYGTPEEIMKSLTEGEATHVVIDHWFPHAYRTLYPVIMEHYPQHFSLVQVVQAQNAQSKDLPTLICQFFVEALPVDEAE